MKLLSRQNFTIIELMIVLIIIALLFILFFWLVPPLARVDMGIRSTKGRLFFAREKIKEFKNSHKRYPSSLKELERYILQDPGIAGQGYGDNFFVEGYSDPKGNTRKVNILDGKGGWYYNKEAGEIRVNLTKPVKYYIKFYFGKHRNEIPSEW